MEALAVLCRPDLERANLEGRLATTCRKCTTSHPTEKQIRLASIRNYGATEENPQGFLAVAQLEVTVCTGCNLLLDYLELVASAQRERAMLSRYAELQRFNPERSHLYSDRARLHRICHEVVTHLPPSGGRDGSVPFMFYLPTDEAREFLGYAFSVHPIGERPCNPHNRDIYSMLGKYCDCEFCVSLAKRFELERAARVSATDH